MAFAMPERPRGRTKDLDVSPARILARFAASILGADWAPPRIPYHAPRACAARVRERLRGNDIEVAHERLLQHALPRLQMDRRRRPTWRLDRSPPAGTVLVLGPVRRVLGVSS